MRTSHHVHFHVLVALRHQVDGVLEGRGIEEDGGDIPEQDAFLGEIWGAQIGEGGLSASTLATNTAIWAMA